MRPILGIAATLIAADVRFDRVRFGLFSGIAHSAITEVQACSDEETEFKMLKPGATATRAPRGSKPVSQAFFAALDSVPEASRAAVAKAAQAMIRDEIKARREKVKAAAAKERSRPVVTPERAKKIIPAKNGAARSKAAPSSKTARS